MTGPAEAGLTGRVALVIGAGSIAPGIGIGRAICLALARDGAFVVAADREISAAEETRAMVAEKGGQAETAEVDVLDDASVEALVAGVIERHGRIDILHCNVGLGKSGPSDGTTADDWRRISDANVTSLHVAAQAAIPTMRKQGRGVITITSSIAAIRYPGFPHLAYGATKAAASHFATALAVELAPDNIRVNAVAPGAINTPMLNGSMARAEDPEAARDYSRNRHAMKRFGRSEEIASGVVYLLSEDASFNTGSVVTIDGGWTAA